MPWLCYRAIACQLANPQFGSVPGHLGMTPAGPCEVPAVGTDSRKRVKVITFDDDSGTVGTIDRHSDDLVNRLASCLVAFSPTDDPVSIRRDSAVSVTQASRYRGLFCDCLRLPVRFLPVQTLIFEIRKEDRVAINAIGAAAVFVHPRAGIECGRDRVGYFSFRRTADDGDAAGFIRTALEPVQFAVRKMEFAETDTGGREQRAGDRRFPGTV